MLSAHHKVDLAQAYYTEQEISNLATNWANLCSRCLQWGHQRISCQPRLICFKCSAPDHKAIHCPLNKQQQSKLVSKSNLLGNQHGQPGSSDSHFPAMHINHTRAHAAATVRCTAHGAYGHVA